MNCGNRTPDLKFESYPTKDFRQLTKRPGFVSAILDVKDKNVETQFDHQAQVYAARVHRLNAKWHSLVTAMIQKGCGYRPTVVRDHLGQPSLNPAMAQYCQ